MLGGGGMRGGGGGMRGGGMRGGMISGGSRPMGYRPSYSNRRFVNRGIGWYGGPGWYGRPWYGGWGGPWYRRWWYGGYYGPGYYGGPCGLWAGGICIVIGLVMLLPIVIVLVAGTSGTVTGVSPFVTEQQSGSPILIPITGSDSITSQNFEYYPETMGQGSNIQINSISSSNGPVELLVMDQNMYNNWKSGSTCSGSGCAYDEVISSLTSQSIPISYGSTWNIVLYNPSTVSTINVSYDYNINAQKYTLTTNYALFGTLFVIFVVVGALIFVFYRRGKKTAVASAAANTQAAGAPGSVSPNPTFGPKNMNQYTVQPSDSSTWNPNTGYSSGGYPPQPSSSAFQQPTSPVNPPIEGYPSAKYSQYTDSTADTKF